MTNFSTTQSNNIASFCGIAVIILAKFNIGISSEELQLTVGLIITLVGNILQYRHRFQKGDITIGGFRK